ncbi:MAG: hypothetical protein V4663_19350 [Bacteroidota bacterium]
MKNLFFAFLTILLSLNACKKKNPEPTLTSFSGMSQTYQGKEIPLFEFSAQPSSKLTAFHATIANGTTTTIKKNNYQLTYKGSNLFGAVIDSYINVTYTWNTKNQIVSASSSKGTLTYTYDDQDRLSIITAPNYTCTYSYHPNGQVNDALIAYSTGYTRVGVESVGGKPNPLKGIPLVYLEGDVPIWALFSLSENIIIGLEYFYLSTQLGPIFTLKERFYYTFDEYDRPATLKRYDWDNKEIGNYRYHY